MGFFLQKIALNTENIRKEAYFSSSKPSIEKEKRQKLQTFVDFKTAGDQSTHPQLDEHLIRPWPKYTQRQHNIHQWKVHKEKTTIVNICLKFKLQKRSFLT